ncbi:metallophosphoesterase [Brachyspira pilosicoli]|uniref:metallophosphoesterase n=1 Tax=Brachyspira pilosicoli TaxID=52584 RepID=UPI00254396A3|nr:metallophosphoesterase [Brachyspira pilosicoli]WIH81614.1 metallophosphoesterase [Brachyspira pilosicoli]
MKVAVIGDLHGKPCWKHLLKDNNFDKIVFLGDYSDDSWVTFTDKEIADNLKDVIEFKRDNNSKVELLIGNHDFQYIVGYPTASRYRKSYACELNKIFNDNKDIFNVVYVLKDYVFTHAGITNGWINYIKKKYDIKDFTDIAKNINMVYSKCKEDCNIASYRRGGMSMFAGILWADIGDLKEDGCFDYNQVVGHNRVKVNTIIEKNNHKIYMCDHFDSDDNYLIVLDV